MSEDKGTLNSHTGGPNEVTSRSKEEAEWQLRLEQLRLTNEELQRRKADAEKDRDLFRDLYSRASAHASDVTRENNELSERASIAEGQVREGLAMIRGTYNQKIRLLEEEVEKWKGLCHISTTKDERTGDELRRRAALEPELRADLQQLAHKVHQLDAENNALKAMLASTNGTMELDGSEQSTNSAATSVSILRDLKNPYPISRRKCRLID